MLFINLFIIRNIDNFFSEKMNKKLMYWFNLKVNMIGSNVVVNSIVFLVVLYFF